MSFTFPQSSEKAVILPITVVLDGPNGGYQQVETEYSEFLRNKVSHNHKLTSKASQQTDNTRGIQSNHWTFEWAIKSHSSPSVAFVFYVSANCGMFVCVVLSKIKN